MLKMLPVLLVLTPFGCASGPHAPQGSAHSEAVAQRNAVHRDPQALIRSCGRPDNSADSVFVQEGGGITSRSLTYSKAHLRFTYISSGPQEWDFSSLVDTETKSALAASDLQSVLEKRLPCAVHTNSEIAQSGDGAGQRAGKSARQRPAKATPDS